MLKLAHNVNNNEKSKWKKNQLKELKKPLLYCILKLFSSSCYDSIAMEDVVLSKTKNNVSLNF